MMRRAKSTAYNFFLLILFSTSIIQFGCQKTSIQFGEEYVGTNITNVVLVDSISPVVSTVFKDSVVTAQTGVVLAGNYTDPYFGKIAASSFLELAPPALTDLLNNAQFDSLVLLLKCNGTYFGDSSLPTTVAASQLTDEIKLHEGQITFYNTSYFPVSPTPLGMKTLVIRPQAGDSVNIHLDNSTGQELFRMIKTKDPILSDNSQFTNYFKGIQIGVQNISNNVFGYRDSVVMRLYYHQTDVFRENLYFDFKLYKKEYQFNNIRYDRTGTPLVILNNRKNEATSNETGNNGYLQSATGLYIKVSFPTIRKLLERTDFVKIIKADLIIKPVLNSYNGQYPLPPQLEAVTTDGSNEPGSSLSTIVGTTTMTQEGNLFVDAIYGANTNYTYDVTSYLLQQIDIAANNKNGLLIIPPSASRYSSLNRLVIGDAKNQQAKMQLKVYYIAINK